MIPLSSPTFWPGGRSRTMMLECLLAPYVPTHPMAPERQASLSLIEGQ